MDKDTFIQQCKELPVGTSKKVQCCGTDRSRILNNLEDRYVTYCFRCEQTYTEHKSALQRLSQMSEKEIVQEMKKHTIPQDCVPDLPSSAVVWLTTAGIHSDVWRGLGFKYSQKYDRVIMPIVQGGETVGHLARGINSKPKYVMSTRNKGVVYTCQKWPTSDTVVITEDILSAWRCKMACPELDVCSILGTSVHSGRKLYLAENYKHVIIWLDPDKAGYVATQQWEQVLRPLVNTVSHVWSEHDPKLHTDAQIRTIIGDKLDVMGNHHAKGFS